jgi:predicted dehydrogenase
MALLESGKHVLSEKPGGLSAAALEQLHALATDTHLVYMVGFNHRYHAAYLEAKKRYDAGEIGTLMFIRARYGFGGRKDYEKEWRFNKAIAGGGELLDQGIHMIDIARLFMGEIDETKGFAENMFWGGEVEDNGFLLLRNASKQVAQIHVSWTNWEWVHSFEIFGSKGYMHIHGLDQRYRGPEQLTIGRADPRSGTFPTEETIAYPDEKKEDSLSRLSDVFASAISGKTPVYPNGQDAAAALRVVETIYAT